MSVLGSQVFGQCLMDSCVPAVVKYRSNFRSLPIRDHFQSATAPNGQISRNVGPATSFGNVHWSLAAPCSFRGCSQMISCAEGGWRGGHSEAASRHHFRKIFVF